jgi:hypothetical protein
MSLIPSAFATGKAFSGIAIVTLILIGISVAIGIDAKKSNGPSDVVSSDVVPSPISTAISSPNSSTPTPVPSPSGTPTGGRDLSQYENGGTLTIPPGASSVVREAILTQTRTFLLRKWNERSLGRLTLVTPASSYEQAAMRKFFVERRTDGVWKITIEMVDAEPAEFTFVQEIGVAANGRPILEPNHPSSPPAVTRALHLKQNATVKMGLVF